MAVARLAADRIFDDSPARTVLEAAPPAVALARLAADMILAKTEEATMPSMVHRAISTQGSHTCKKLCHGQGHWNWGFPTASAGAG